MNCFTARKHLESLAGNEISPKTAHSVRQHLRGCPRCQQQYLEIQQARELLAEAASIAPPPEFGAAWRLRIRREVTQSVEPGRKGCGFLRNRFLLPAFGTAAVVLMVLAIARFDLFKENTPNLTRNLPSMPSAKSFSIQAEFAPEQSKVTYRLEILSFGAHNKEVQKLARNFRGSHEAGPYYALRQETTSLSIFTGLSEQEAHEFQAELEKTGARVEVRAEEVANSGAKETKPDTNHTK